MNGQNPILYGPKIRQFELTLPAGGQVDVQMDARFFYFTEADYRLKVSIENGEPLDYSVGLGYECEQGEYIERVKVINPLAVPCFFRVFYGRGNVPDFRLNVLEDRNGSAASLVPNGAALTSANVLSGVEGVLLVSNPNRKRAIIRAVAVGGTVANNEFIHIFSGLESEGKLIAQIIFTSGAGGDNRAGNVYYVEVSNFNANGFVFELPDFSGPVNAGNFTSDEVEFSGTELVYS